VSRRDTSVRDRGSDKLFCIIISLACWPAKNRKMLEQEAGYVRRWEVMVLTLSS
jgi:hypothetical protein